MGKAMAISQAATQNANFTDSLRSLGSGNIGAPLILLIMMGMMILPIPAFLLDVFFSFNIALAIVVSHLSQPFCLWPLFCV
jgi:flagellar biosynthesis protein FlhA